MGPALEKTCPEWFSSGSGTVPVVVRLHADVDDVERSSPFVLLSAASLFTAPGYSPLRFRLGASIGLGPGEWSDADSIPAREDFLIFNPVSSLAFSWFLSEEGGWRRAARLDRTSQDENRVSVAFYLQGGEERNDAFLRIVSSLVAKAWTDLSPAQRRKAAENPVAINDPGNDGRNELRVNDAAAAWADERALRFRMYRLTAAFAAEAVVFIPDGKMHGRVRRIKRLARAMPVLPQLPELHIMPARRRRDGRHADLHVEHRHGERDEPRRRIASGESSADTSQAAAATSASGATPESPVASSL